MSSLGGMTLGYDTGIGGGVIALTSFQKAFYGRMLSRSAIATLNSNVVSVLFGGAFVGSVMATPLTNYIGRRYGLMVACTVFILGALVQIGHTSDIAFIYGGRFVSGLGIGAFSNLCPLYIAESAPKNIRGQLTGLFQLSLVIGSLWAYFLTYGVSIHWPTGNRQWRFALGMQALPAFIMFVGLFFTVDSPRFLVMARRDKEGIRVLAYLRKKDVDDPVIQAEYAGICAQRDEAIHPSAFLKELFLAKYRKSLFAGIWIPILALWCGQNSILYYGPTVFQSIGYNSTSSALLATGIFTVIKVVCTAIFLVVFADRYGRRTIMLFGSAGQALTIFILGGILSKYSTGMIPLAAGRAMVAMVYLFEITYSFTWGPIFWIYLAEIFPPRLRQTSMAIGTAMTWLINYAVAKATPIALAQIGWKFWIIIGFFNCLGFTVYFLPETRGASLEDMVVLFGVVNAPPSVEPKNDEELSRDIEESIIKHPNMTQSV
ncbi:permease of the major facilitator superfamily [Hysterangium stoloniferum]|nr:permease of the major facilitator superfamily [Hysterangium stoloniferum]